MVYVDKFLGPYKVSSDMAQIINILHQKCYWQQVAIQKTIMYNVNITRQYYHIAITTALIKGHKYYVSFDWERFDDDTIPPSNYKFKLGNSGYGEFELTPTVGFNEKLGWYNNQSGGAPTDTPYYYVQAYVTGRSHIKASNIQIFDLTVMYGSGNEPSSIADFKKDFKFKYYGYNILSD